MGKTTVVVSLALSLAIAECIQTAADRCPVEAIHVEEQERV
jgi:ferredoxin